MRIGATASDGTEMSIHWCPFIPVNFCVAVDWVALMMVVQNIAVQADSQVAGQLNEVRVKVISQWCASAGLPS